jgi:hypothetical protein
MALYDAIGAGYRRTRRPDRRIEKLWQMSW